MNKSSAQYHFINRMFLIWILTANVLWVLAPSNSLAHYLGDSWLWSFLMPGLCLAALNTRRSLALVAAIIWLPVVIAARLWPRLQFRELL
jgi:hypothetical protein